MEYVRCMMMMRNVRWGYFVGKIPLNVISCQNVKSKVDGVQADGEQ